MHGPRMPALAKKAECGGAVSGLLKYALESKMVDAVLAVKRGVDLYDAVPTLISDPKDIDQTAGSLHCGTVLLSKLVTSYVPSMAGKKLGIVVKGCDMMGIPRDGEAQAGQPGQRPHDRRQLRRHGQPRSTHGR